MSKIKLTYYNGKGRAETARLVLAYAGKEYDDHRIVPEDMATLKPSLPFGQLPILEYEGTTISQSMAIARFLAREYGLAGQNALEEAKIDETVDAITDFQNALYATHFERDEEIKKEKLKKVLEETIPQTLGNLEKRLEKRGGQYFSGNGMSWAELHFLQIMEMVLSVNAVALDSFPKLKSLYERVQKIPNIENWLNTRPKTDF